MLAFAGEIRKQSGSPLAVRLNAFTLIELLVVIGILLTISAMTLGVVRLATDADKVRAAARQVQSTIAGARDRAIYSGRPRGVRLITIGSDAGNSQPENLRIVTGLQPIEQPPPYSVGQVQLERPVQNVYDIFPSPLVTYPAPVFGGSNPTFPPLPAEPNGFYPNPLVPVFQTPPSNTRVNDVCVIAEIRKLSASDEVAPTGWQNLADAGQLQAGTRIRITSGADDVWCTVLGFVLETYLAPDGTSFTRPKLYLTQPVTKFGMADTSASTLKAFSERQFTYQLELAPVPSPGSAAVALPTGSCIHLDRCTADPLTLSKLGDKLPGEWKNNTPVLGTNYPFGYRVSNLDLLFAPSGELTGPSASRGVIHLYIADLKDALEDHRVWQANDTPLPEFGERATDKRERLDRLVMTVFGRTGAVSSHAIDPRTSNGQVSGPLIDRFRLAETGEVAGK